MACLRVKPLQNLKELQNCCLSHTQSALKKKGFVNYGYQVCQGSRLGGGAVVVVNNYSTDSSCSNSTTFSSSSGSSVFDIHHYGSQSGSENSIYPKKKRMIDEEEDVSGKLDQWVKDSVFEILNNLDEAPFLVHIYSDGEEGSASTRKRRLVREKASAERWPHIKERWGGGGRPTPYGMILVEEMKSRPDGEIMGNSSSGIDDKDSCSSSTKVWGILIQGKGLSWPACYILKTSRVRSVSGFCTHFCLVRVECFYESVDIQLKKLWLL